MEAALNLKNLCAAVIRISSGGTHAAAKASWIPKVAAANALDRSGPKLVFILRTVLARGEHHRARTH